MQVSVLGPMQKYPRTSTAAAAHNVSASCLTFFEELFVSSDNLSRSLHFKLREHSHCALVNSTYPLYDPWALLFDSISATF